MPLTDHARYIQAEIFRVLQLDAQIDDQSGRTLTGQTSPVVRVLPTSEAEVSALLRFAYEQQWRVMPLGAQTQVQLGRKSDPIDIVLSLERLNRVLEYSPTDMTIVVESGLSLAALQDTVRVHGQMLPFDPICDQRATVGGLVATNASGPSRALYGSLRDLVIGLTVIYPDGQVIRTGGKVVKNVAGYDMTKLFIGSLGTLAVITQIVCKLKPRPARSDVVLLRGQSADIKTFLKTLADSETVLSRVELMTGAALTESDEYLFALGCDEDVAAADIQANEIQALSASHHLHFIRGLATAADEFWNEYQGQLVVASTVIRLTCPSTEMISIAEKIHRRIVLEPFSALSMTVTVGILRVFLRDQSEKSTLEILQLCRDLAGRVKGTAVIEKALPISQESFDPFGPVPSSIKVLLDEIKQTIDQRRILSPGRFAGGI